MRIKEDCYCGLLCFNRACQWITSIDHGLEQKKSPAECKSAEAHKKNIISKLYHEN